MAQHFNDFSQYTVGQFPSDWLAYTEATDGSGGVGDTRHLNVVDLSVEGVGTGKGLKFNAVGTTANGSLPRLYIWDAIAESADQEVYYEMRFNFSSNNEVQAALRADFSALPTKNWYQLGPRSASDLDINKHVNDVFVNLNNDTTQDWVVQDVWASCRARVNGTALEVKVWFDGESEPAAWTVTDTDSDLASGKLGITTFREDVFYIRNLGAGTGGDSAPTEAVATTPTIRKSSTFDIETTLTGSLTGTGASATLNGNAITVNSHTGTTVNLIDDNSGITTSGEYSLVLTDDTAATETITVQVNVVGLPSNTAKKDGGILVSLSDLTLDAVNASGTLVKQLTGLTTDASGIISPVDLSDISEAVGDTLKVSLHSAASDVGVTFEQALENI